jgi:hypothetical protein
MTTARDIVSDTLRFGLNRLSPGETLDPDVAAYALAGLNQVVDELNGVKSVLFREILTSAAVTGMTATLGATWPTLAPGDEILGASISYGEGLDTPIALITMATYQAIPQKATGGLPMWLAQDGGPTVYLWPAASGQTITLRTKQAFEDFADLDTDYSMPKGYKSAFSALLTEKLGLGLVGGLTPAMVRAANMARTRIACQTVNPAIARAGVRRGNILAGWNS